MKIVFILSCLFDVILSVSWPTSTKTITLSSPITVEEGKTFDGFKENNNKWVTYERGVKNLCDCLSVKGGSKDSCFILKKGAI